MATKKTTLVTFVLDETGSMESIKDDTIGGFNSYLDSLRDESDGPVEFTLLKFDSRRVEKVYVNEPVANVAKLTPETYRPGAMTPLIDASYKAILATANSLKKREDNPNVICVIQTDGYENASEEYTTPELAKLIRRKEKEGWVFLFLGAGLDAFSTAREFGIKLGMTLSYGREKSQAAFDAISSNTRAYRKTGKAADMVFSEPQRDGAGDRYYERHAGRAPKRDGATVVEDISLDS
jgi:hypothetical protein